MNYSTNEIHAWIIIDEGNDPPYSASFYYGKDLWGNNRDRAKIYEHKQDAEKMALKLDSNAKEVIMCNSILDRKFTVLDWQ